MGTRSARASTSGKDARAETPGGDEILYGWKSIAECLQCSTKTAQRLEKSEGLPVLRPDKRKKWRVLALRRSLIAWMTGGIASAAISGNILLAFDRRTRVLWAHEFPHPLCTMNAEELEWRLRVLDLEGDGAQGVLFTARYLSSSRLDTLTYFSPTGHIEWQLEANPPLLDREGRSFDRAWGFTHVVTTPKEHGSTIWASMVNHAGWAGCVLRIEADGTATVQLANAGFVERLCPVSSGENNYIIACGENNDYDDAFAALLGTDDPPACSIPGERLVYRFANAPSGQPRKYILFPKTELIVAHGRPYGPATRIPEHADGVIIRVATGEDDAYFLYHFSKDLDPRYVFPSGNHEFAHRQLEAKGVIPHAWLDCPELQAPLTVRIWEPDSGWYERPVDWRDNPWKEIQGSRP